MKIEFISTFFKINMEIISQYGVIYSKIILKNLFKLMGGRYDKFTY
jgi:hypothetical protein